MPRARLRRGGAVIFQAEMRGLAFAIAFFFGFIPLRLLQCLLDFRIGTQPFGALPFLNRQFHFVRAVVGPAH